MGLDITAYSHLSPVECDRNGGVFCTKEDEHWDQLHRDSFAYACFEKSFAGIPVQRRAEINGNGSVFVLGPCYVETPQSETCDFKAGSYGGYNVWRAQLAEFAGIPDLERFWDNPDYGMPFAELLNFADNEGCIGPEAAANLWGDFRDHREKAEALFDEGEPDSAYFLSKYTMWTEAFDLAKNDGMVQFH